jgi:Short C-terminal domain
MPLVRRRRPLLRAAAVGGAAYMGKRAGERDAQREQPAGEQPAGQGFSAAPAPPPAGGGLSSESVTRLKELAELHDQGVLTDAEFEQQKRALLGGGS